jgi:tetratricopeptide (TPR) repeat protein
LRISQIILLLTGVALVVALYFFGVTQPTKNDAKAITGEMQTTASANNISISFETILQKAQNIITNEQRDSLAFMQTQLDKAKEVQQKAVLLYSLAEKWSETGNIIVAGKYFEEAAEITNDIKTWEQAASRFFVGFPNAADTLTKIFAVQEGIKCYERLRQLDTSNIDYLIRQAICYIDGQGQVMQGVTLLKTVERKDPNNVDMNLILGRLAVVSGQYDKAIARLEKLVTTDPKNAEAYFHLAEAYRAVGRKNDAINTLERCKTLIEDEDFNDQINSYINQIKNS